jgi:prepilin-type N-terminal cleavage/methylation domain-containing protein
MIIVKPPSRRGVTLVEMLVAASIVLMLASLALPVISRIREQANVIACRNNLHQLALAVHHHHEQKRTMPPYASGMNGEVYGSWFIHLLPFLEQGELYNSIHVQQKATKGKIRLITMVNSAPGIGDVAFPFLLCGSDPSRKDSFEDANKTNYLANWYAWGTGSGGAYTPRQSFGQLTDGLSNIILFGEGYSLCKKTPRLALVSNFYHNFGITPKGKPSDDPSNLPADYTMFQSHPRVKDCDPWRAQAPHEVMNIVLADGSVRGVRPEIGADNWKHALQPRDEVTVPTDW